MGENKKPKHFLIFKIMGVVGILLALGGIVLTVSGFGDFETNNFMIGGMMLVFGFAMASTGCILGFAPEMSKMATKTAKYIQSENKEDLQDIATGAAEIKEEAVTKTARAIKKGLKDDTMFCKHCGAEIDADSTFCNKCGKEQ